MCFLFKKLAVNIFVMNKFLKLLLYILSLYILETVLCFLLFVAEHKYKGYNGWGLGGALRDTLDVNGMRIIFYGIPHIIFFILIITAYNLHKTLYAALINCALYIGLSLIVGAIFGVLEYLRATSSTF